MPEQSVECRLPVHEQFQAEYLQYYQLLPIDIEDGRLIVAYAGTPNTDALEDLERTYGAPATLQAFAADVLEQGIRRAFSTHESVVELVRDLDASAFEASSEPGLYADARDLASQPPVIRYVNMLIREAHQMHASDVHLEAAQEGLRVRARIDGVLGELPSPPAALQGAVISRLKLLADLDIAERRKPQDGRIRVRLNTSDLDLRVATVPTLFGESVALRLLDRAGDRISLDELGMDPPLLTRLATVLGRSSGIVLVTGPTGSGKTTTLYGALGRRDPAVEKIITVEDPVEYHLPGVTQVPVHRAAGVSFASAVRHLLRQDPDVIMIGEMRDAETAAVGVQAAMTGHLVLSTLHTNDAASAVTRLRDLGVEPYMIASTLEAVLAQRLVRRVCDHCREPYAPAAALVSAIAGDGLGGPRRFEHGAGCPQCRFTGYRGRIGLFELLLVGDELRDILLGDCSTARVREVAGRRGAGSLREDGLAKVAAGLTTLEEVARVTNA